MDDLTAATRARLLGAGAIVILVAGIVAPQATGVWNAAAVAPSVATCVLPEDVPAALEAIGDEKAEAVATRLRVSGELKALDVERRALLAERASSTAAVRKLAASVPTDQARAAARAKASTLEARLGVLSGKAALTAAERRELASLPAKAESARAEATRLEGLGPLYQLRAQTWADRDAEIASRLAAIDSDVAEGRRVLAAAAAAVAAAPKREREVRASECACLGGADEGTLARHVEVVSGHPSLIKDAQAARDEVKRRLDAAEKTLREARADAAKATPAAVAAASSTHAAALRSYQSGQMAFASYRPIQLNWYKLRDAAGKLERALADAERLRAEHAAAVAEVARLDSELRTARAEKPKLERKVRASGGTLCAEIAESRAAAGLGTSGSSGTGSASGGAGTGGASNGAGGTSNGTGGENPTSDWFRGGGGGGTMYTAENTPQTCHDGVDNDGDLAIDCAEDMTCLENDCVEFPDYCHDGVDNDADGAADDDDIDCEERSEVANCFDGIDNDRDGDIDCLDVDCAGKCFSPEENNTSECTDGFDNDADGLTDCSDDSCDGVVIDSNVGGSQGNGVHCFNEVACYGVVKVCSERMTGYAQGGPVDNTDGCANGIDDDDDGMVDLADNDCDTVDECDPLDLCDVDCPDFDFCQCMPDDPFCSKQL